MGMLFWAISSSAPLAAIQTAANRIQPRWAPSSPQPSLSPTGQPHSKIPAIVRYIQAIGLRFLLFELK